MTVTIPRELLITLIAKAAALDFLDARDPDGVFSVEDTKALEACVQEAISYQLDALSD